MVPPFVIFGREIGPYGIMALLGLLAALLYGWLTNRGGRAGRLKSDDLLHIFLMAVAGALVGAKLLFLIVNIPLFAYNWELIVAQPAVLLDFLLSGMVFYGGLIGGLLAVLWYCRRYKLAFKTVAGLATPMIPLFHTFGRVGCFLGGCCWGAPAPWGVVYRHSPAGAAPHGVPLIPVQLFEAAGNFVLFLVLAWLSRKLVRKWLVLPLYLACYAAMRFVLEFYRGDAARGVWLLSTSQWIALGVLVGVATWWWRGVKGKPALPS